MTKPTYASALDHLAETLKDLAHELNRAWFGKGAVYGDTVDSVPVRPVREENHSVKSRP